MTTAPWTPDELRYQDEAIGMPRPLPDVVDIADSVDDVAPRDWAAVSRLFDLLNNSAESNALIDAVEVAMAAAAHFADDDSELRMFDLIPSHQFSDNAHQYIRRLVIPAGSLITSRQHLTDHVCVLESGSITFWSRETGILTVEAPLVFMSAAGSRRIGVTHSEVVWATFHDNADQKQDIEAIEARLYAPYIKPIDRPETQRMIESLAATQIEVEECRQ